MAKKEIGRNDPCPCGSGIKYKKCCCSKRESLLLPAHDEIDYGKPLINDDFFIYNHCHETSAPRLIYSVMLSPEAERIAQQISLQYVNRGGDEALLIKNSENVQQLIDIMKKVPDSLNRVTLLDRLLQFKEAAIPIIIEELKKKQHHAFFEIAVRFLHASGGDYSEEIIDIIKNHQREAYAVSLLCMLLGFHDNTKSEKLAWDYFHYFKEKWPHKTFCDGPLISLYEAREQRAERNLNTTRH